MPDQRFNQYDVNITMMTLENIQGSGNSIDFLETETFLSLSLYEDMFAPSLSGRILLKDTIDWASSLPLTGEEILWMDISSVDSNGEDRIIQVPPLYVYNIQPIEGEEFVHGRQWVLDFSSWTHIVGNWDESHLTGLLSEEQDQETETFFMGPIHELAQNIMTNNTSFTDGWGGGEEHEPLVDNTGNQIYYKPNQGSYSVIRKDTQQKPLELLTQLAENAIDEENPNAVNFVFYQDLDRWNFRSIDKMVQEEPVKTLTGGIATSSGYDSRDRIVGHTVIRQTNNFDNAQNGFFASTMQFYIPRINVEDFPVWFTGNIETYYYKVNCRYKDHFPAAIVGFEQIEPFKARWRYAFAEVYLVFDYENKTPQFKIKPIEHGGMRSWVTYNEEGPSWINGQDGKDYFGRAAFNTVENGNDGVLDYDQRQGWEAPGYRLDTKLWEKSCMKIQPIRGSFDGDQKGETGLLNNVSKVTPETAPDDDTDTVEKYPIVDMKIYYDQDGEPQFFFDMANAVDGECKEDETNDCKDCEDCDD